MDHHKMNLNKKVKTQGKDYPSIKRHSISKKYNSSHSLVPFLCIDICLNVETFEIKLDFMYLGNFNSC